MNLKLVMKAGNAAKEYSKDRSYKSKNRGASAVHPSERRYLPPFASFAFSGFHGENSVKKKWRVTK